MSTLLGDGHPARTNSAPGRRATAAQAIEYAVNDWVANADRHVGDAVLESLARHGYQVLTADQVGARVLTAAVKTLDDKADIEYGFQRVDELIADRERRRVPFVRVACVRAALAGTT